MKALLLMLSLATLPIGALAAPEFSVPDAAAPQYYAQRVMDSDHATISVLDADKKLKTITVTDRDWLEQFSKILATAIYQPQSHIFAIGPPIIFYRKDGSKIVEIEVFGTAARFDSRDYEVGKKTCDAIADLVRRKKG